MVIKIALMTVLLPALLSGGILLAGWLASGKTARFMTWLAPLALVAGYLVGFVALLGLPALPPVDISGTIFVLAIGAAMLGLVERRWLQRPWLRWPLRVLLLGLASRLILAPLVAYSFGFAQSAMHVLALTAVATLLLWQFEQLKKTVDPRLFLSLVLLLSLSVSIATVLAQSASLAQLLGVLCAVLGAALVFALVFARSTLDLDAAVLPIAVVLWAPAAGAHYYAELSLWPVVLLLCAPAVALGLWKLRDGLRFKIAGVVAAGVVASAAIVLIGFA